MRSISEPSCKIELHNLADLPADRQELGPISMNGNPVLYNRREESFDSFTPGKETGSLIA